MKTLIDFDDAPVFGIPMVGGAGTREGMLLEGPQGWGEFSPFADDDDHTAARWLTAAVEPGTVGWPDPVRGRVPVAVTVPDGDAAQAHAAAASAGCRTAEVAVADPRSSLANDVERIQAVRDALGPDAAIRCTAGGAWDVDTAVSAIGALNRAAGGLEYVEQPCRTLVELAEVRRRVDVRIAADVSVDPPERPRPGWLAEAADVAVLRCAPLGGVRRALVVADRCGLPCVVSSALETSIGLSAGLALAGALPELDYACGLGTTSLLAADLVSAPRALVPVHGYLPVAPMPPGPDPELLARHALTDAGRIAWWRDRLARVRAVS